MVSKKPVTAVVAQPAHVDVDIPVAGFVDIINTPNGPGDPRLCTATVRLRTPAPTGISQPVYPGPIIVQRVMKIDFDLPAATGCKLAGIVFKRMRGGGSSNGHRNFPKEKIFITEDPVTGDTTLSVTDMWRDHGNSGDFSWEIFLVVQDITTGNIGLIDPDVENDN